MCAEKEPLNCHRMLLVSRALEKDGASVTHILADGNIEQQDRPALIAAACKLREDKSAFVKT